MSTDSHLSQNKINEEEDEDDLVREDSYQEEDFNQFPIQNHQNDRHPYQSIPYSIPPQNHTHQPYPLVPPPFIDPTLQLQFFEARMRDHAALYAQYASAAAGAAAQLASSVSMYPSSLPNPMPFYHPLNTSLDHHYGPSPIMSSAGYHSSSNMGFQQHQNQAFDRHRPPIEYDGSRKAEYNSEEANFVDVNNKAKKQKRTTPTQQSHSYQIHQQQALQSNIELNRRIRRRKDQVATSVVALTSNSRIQSTKLSSKQLSIHRGKRSKLLLPSNKVPDVSGKTVVRALYEICDKRRWSAPQFNEYDNLQTNDGSSSSTYSHTDFIMAIIINGVELSRSRGASKKAAQQDAARKALMKLFPDAVFDIYGILVDLGSVDRSKIFFDHSVNAVDIGEDLAPSLASRLAIDGIHEKGRLSPSPSEDSSISTAVSMKRSKVSSVVTGGPLHDGKRRPKSLFPTASTTSGVSSASEEIDDDQYLASRGASVCSTLLNVMVQIDSRIRDQPTYSFDVCSRTTVGPPNSSKRKELECNGDSMTSKRRSTTQNGKPITIHQTSFECTATLDLYEENESNGNEEDKITVKCLKAIGTGTTKRAARHVASAKLLELLFPECNGMAEVKAAAEAAQERNAAKRLGKRTSQQPNEKFTKRSIGSNDAPISTEDEFVLSLFRPKANDTLSESLVQTLVSYCGKSSVKCKDPPGSALAKLSLSEQNNEVISSVTSTCQRSCRERFEAAVDEALYELHLQEDEVKASSGCVEENELGKTVLRRASIEDCKTVENLFGKTRSSKKDQDSSTLLTHISGDSVDSTKISNANKNSSRLRNISSIWNQDVVILLLYRSEEALGCAILSLGFSLEYGRTLRISDLFHKEHYPKERFVDCLRSLAQIMKYKLEDRTIIKSKDVVLSRDFLKNFIEKQLAPIDSAETERKNQDDQINSKQELHRKPLQAVKEEDESDDDEKSDQILKKRLKLE